jgi:type I restriction enzyme, S subunit
MTTLSLTERAAIHIPSLAGQLAKGWRWHRLDEVCEGIFDCPHSTPVLTDAGPYVVRTQDILSQRFRGDLAARVSEDTYRLGQLLSTLTRHFPLLAGTHEARTQLRFARWA